MKDIQKDDIVFWDGDYWLVISAKNGNYTLYLSGLPTETVREDEITEIYRKI